ncbi:hypothetical protein C9374_013900 [Naegleria lovaniensis]|uniref:Microbial-type PARG catalytic domain-containing protein n=1 Tax=Naegleria lovaniensis TaxID=51637 RepID=A0AA88GYE4_NAELO|nr:uncharacterized protein C9374_013900 [Naegleria lovaniensis]KAG2389340.1 hypothetical protein C9374_013900 [Naegleria lovaniensis]
MLNSSSSSTSSSYSSNYNNKIKLPACPDTFFDDPLFNTKRVEFDSFIYDPNQFVRIFTGMVNNKQFDRLKRLRVLIQNHTISICRKQCYAYMPCHVGNTVKSEVVNEEMQNSEEREYEIIPLRKDLLERASIMSKFYQNETLTVHNNNNNGSESLTKVMVFNGDCLDVAFYIQDELIKEGKYPQERVAVLNMANPNTPGGGYKGGCGAQEENLHRRSNLYMCLDNHVDNIDKTRSWNYPIGYESGVYSPNVTIFRGCEAKGYPLLKTPRLVDIITAAAVPLNRSTVHGVDPRNTGTIEAILKIAVHHGVRNLVLSAFGCGAFRNDPVKIAEIVKEKIESEEFKNCFDRIYFAIIEDHNSRKQHNPEGNIKPFADTFAEYIERNDSQRFLESQLDYDYDNMNDIYAYTYNNMN